MTVLATESTRQLAVRVNTTVDTIFRGYARVVHEGNLSRAFAALVHLYAGERVADPLGPEAPDQVDDVDRWNRPRLSRRLAGEVCAAVRAGNLRRDAFTFAGVSDRQARTWLAQGRADLANDTPSIYADLVMGLERAEAELRFEEVTKARKAGDYKFVLSRQFPADYGERKQTSSTITHQFQPAIDWERLTIPEARALVELMRKASPERDDVDLKKGLRPAAELIPAEVLESVDDAEVGEWESLPLGESPVSSESPVTSETGVGGSEAHRTPMGSGADVVPSDAAGSRTGADVSGGRTGSDASARVDVPPAAATDGAPRELEPGPRDATE